MCFRVCGEDGGQAPQGRHGQGWRGLRLNRWFAMFIRVIHSPRVFTPPQAGCSLWAGWEGRGHRGAARGGR